MAKCKNCGAEIDSSVAYKIGRSSYYCDELCYRDKQSKQKANKDKYKPKDGTDRKYYTDYIQSIYLDNGYDKTEINWTLLMSQTKNILSDNPRWTYSTLQYILYYMYEILELNLFKQDISGSILNLIPYYGLEAEKYYNQTVEVEIIVIYLTLKTIL